MYRNLNHLKAVHQKYVLLKSVNKPMNMWIKYINTMSFMEQI